MEQAGLPPVRQLRPCSHDAPRVAHTLTACSRCRHRKTRCDVGLPRCGPCHRNNAYCEYFDVAKGRTMPRSYVVALQNRVQALELELTRSSSRPMDASDAELLVRGGSHVKIKENDDDSRFLGPSSGIAMTRLVFEWAKYLLKTKSVAEIVPVKKAQEIRARFAREASKPTSKVYPLISNVAAPTLPSFELTEGLIKIFSLKAQYLYPTLHEPSFRQVVRDVYNGSTDAYQNFVVRMVIAISMQKLDSLYAGLADSYYLAALPYLESAMRPRNLGTLQCFILVAQYSTTTPTRTAAYWIIGLAARLCQELGLTDEATLTCDNEGRPLDILTVDMRRRVFWICASMELGLAHSLGRPSAFNMSHDNVNIKPFLEIDDQCISAKGVPSDSSPSMKKRIAMHFMRLRLLQLEIRRTLYLRKRSAPLSDNDPWFNQMEHKVNEWMALAPANDEGSGFSETWFRARYNTMVVLLFRPSPQVPRPSIRAAELCFEASRFNIHVQRHQIDAKDIDVTWIFTQSLFMAINTLLWSLSYPEIRAKNAKSEVERHLQTALEAIFLASTRWPGVETALELYITLAEACITAYDSDHDLKQEFMTPLHEEREPTTLPFDDSHKTLTTSETIISPQAGQGAPRLTEGYIQLPPLDASQARIPHHRDDHSRIQKIEGPHIASAPPPATGSIIPAAVQSIIFDPHSYDNPLPAALAYTSEVGSWDLGVDSFANNGELPAQFFHAEHPSIPAGSPLNMQQHAELMSSLEATGLEHLVGV